MIKLTLLNYLSAEYDMVLAEGSPCVTRAIYALTEVKSMGETACLADEEDVGEDIGMFRDTPFYSLPYIGRPGPEPKPDPTRARPPRSEILTPDPAFLNFVALISVDGFWLLADANWKQTKISPSLADAKATCCMVAPELPPFANDFSEVLNNVKWFMQQCATAGNTKQ
ncbi:hypothetical protein B0H11DRAFT_1927144 [Mycena galericulata]|nr:hypothetical protein B0H11DRAFT_1927144 [Mycena galericulata]